MSDSAAVRDIPSPRATLAELSTAVAITLGLFASAVSLASCGKSPRPRAPMAPAADAATGTAAQKAALAAKAPAPPPRGKQIVIAYSSNLLGEYEPCG